MAKLIHPTEAKIIQKCSSIIINIGLIEKYEDKTPKSKTSDESNEHSV